MICHDNNKDNKKNNCEDLARQTLLYNKLTLKERGVFCEPIIDIDSPYKTNY